MGLLTPAPPPFDVEEWKRPSHLERIKPLAQDWAVNGFGTPPGGLPPLHGQVLVYAGRRAAADLGDQPASADSAISSWWTQPIVFQKAVIWTMLWEVLGLGAGSLPLTLRFSPMVGGFLYWLRPGTIAPAALARPGAAHRGHDADALRRRPLRGAARRRRFPAGLAGVMHRRRRRRPSRPDRRSASCSPSSSCSACATRCRSSPPGPRSTAPML